MLSDCNVLLRAASELYWSLVQLMQLRCSACRRVKLATCGRAIERQLWTEHHYRFHV